MDASTDAFDIVMAALDRGAASFNGVQRRAIINKLNQKTNTVGARETRPVDMDEGAARRVKNRGNSMLGTGSAKDQTALLQNMDVALIKAKG